jgi:type II secretory pathway pseudopilin PulG
MVLVALAIASLLMASQVSMMIAHQRTVRQARAKEQARWLAESALDRARLSRPQPDQEAAVWRPDVSPAGLPPLAASARLETGKGNGQLVVVARVGKDGTPNIAQHILREPLPKEPEP